MCDTNHPPAAVLDIDNEFASVRLSVVDSAPGRRLLITDRVTGDSRRLDALEVEALIWATHEDFDRLMDPSHSRWKVMRDE